MGIFTKKKKSETPIERYNKAKNRINKLMKERDDLDKNQRWKLDYDEKRKKINRQIAEAIDDKHLAEEEIKHPKPVPKNVSVDNSKHTTFTTTVGDINSGNKKAVVEALNGNKVEASKKQSDKKSQKSSKKPKAKTIFLWIVAILVLAGVIALTVKITNCVRDIQDNSSSAYYAITI